jgi:hypothetical protein
MEDRPKCGIELVEWPSCGRRFCVRCGFEEVENGDGY